MRNLIGTLLIGLTLGSVYSLMALALVLVWRSTRVVNFAQAGQAIVTTYIAYEIVTRTGVFWLAVLFAVAAGALIGAGVEYFLMRTLFRHVDEGPVAALAPVIATLGLLGVIRSIVGMIWGNDFRTFYSPVSTDNFVIAGETIPFSRLNLLIILSTVVVMIIFSIIFQRTDLGLSLRAAAFQPEIARLAGIRVGPIRTLGWVFAGVAGAIAGVLVTPTTILSPNSLDLFLVFGFVAAVIGGLESLPGAVIGGLVLGLGVSFVLNYVGTSLVFPSIFVVLIISLIVRPNGILGAKKVRSA
ncbi:MAG: branched-chain amino acid ABC transporter permease [Actinobacteria bacterium]|jgi:branched-chain amino acid transport system permease protein|nr:branched-chain amino acid ABC transporter permease [Actinomycetota bacterium]